MEEKLDKVLLVVERMEKKLDKQTVEIENIKEKNRKLEEALVVLQNKVDYLENQSRRNNLIIYGISEEVNEDWNVTENLVKMFLETHFKVTIANSDIERAHRLGYNRNNNKRPVIVKFLNFKTKDRILKMGKCLRGTNYAIAEDYSEQIKTERNKLKPYLIAAKSEGKKAFLSFDKLVIEGQRMTYQDVCKKLENKSIPQNNSTPGPSETKKNEENSDRQLRSRINSTKNGKQ